MTKNSEPISPLRQRMIEDMKVRRLSSKIQIGYIRAIKRFSDLTVSQLAMNFRGT